MYNPLRRPFLLIYLGHLINPRFHVVVAYEKLRTQGVLFSGAIIKLINHNVFRKKLTANPASFVDSFIHSYSTSTY